MQQDVEEHVGFNLNVRPNLSVCFMLNTSFLRISITISAFVCVTSVTNDLSQTSRKAVHCISHTSFNYGRPME